MHLCLLCAQGISHAPSTALRETLLSFLSLVDSLICQRQPQRNRVCLQLLWIINGPSTAAISPDIKMLDHELVGFPNSFC